MSFEPRIESGVVPGPGTKESQKKPRVSLSLTGVFFFSLFIDFLWLVRHGSRDH